MIQRHLVLSMGEYSFGSDGMCAQCGCHTAVRIYFSEEFLANRVTVQLIIRGHSNWASRTSGVSIAFHCHECVPYAIRMGCRQPAINQRTCIVCRLRVLPTQNQSWHFLGIAARIRHVSKLPTRAHNRKYRQIQLNPNPQFRWQPMSVVVAVGIPHWRWFCLMNDEDRRWHFKKEFYSFFPSGSRRARPLCSICCRFDRIQLSARHSDKCDNDDIHITQQSRGTSYHTQREIPIGRHTPTPVPGSVV